MPNLPTAVLILVPPAILGLVNLIKSFGVAGRVLTGISFLIGLAVALAAYYLPVDTFTPILYALLFGLSASGLYDFGVLIGGAAPGKETAEKK